MRSWLSLLMILCLTSSGTVLAQDALEYQMAQFEIADAALNEAYALAEEVLPPAAYERLRVEQRAWLAARDPLAEQYAATAEGVEGDGARESSTFHMVRAQFTEMRTAVISGLVSYYQDPSAYTWDGYWVDGAGGDIAIRDLGGAKLSFRLTVTRGPTYHSGWLDGVADQNGELAYFVTTFETNRGDEPVWIFMVREGPYLYVRTANAQYFHGARAYFDGAYVRSRDLRPYDLD